jgi:2-dehydro-3-deoxygluconokinase
MKRFLSIGECMVEFALQSDGSYRRHFAGDTFNCAWHVRQALPAHWLVDYFTALGDDATSDEMAYFMAAQGIGTSHVQRVAGASPGLYVIALKHGERSFSYWRGQSAARQLARNVEALQTAVLAADAIFFSGITLAILSATDRTVFYKVLAEAKARSKMVAFDSNIRLRLWQDQTELQNAMAAAASVSTLALPSFEDEAQAFADRTAEEVVARYRKWGVEEIVVRDGAKPACFHSPMGQGAIAPAATVAPVDTTGAGDSFNGAYLAARLIGHGPAEAIARAHLNAARVIQKPGALV